MIYFFFLHHYFWCSLLIALDLRLIEVMIVDFFLFWKESVIVIVQWVKVLRSDTSQIMTISRDFEQNFLKDLLCWEMEIDVCQKELFWNRKLYFHCLISFSTSCPNFGMCALHTELSLSNYYFTILCVIYFPIAGFCKVMGKSVSLGRLL